MILVKPVEIIRRLHTAEVGRAVPDPDVVIAHLTAPAGMFGGTYTSLALISTEIAGEARPCPIAQIPNAILTLMRPAWIHVWLMVEMPLQRLHGEASDVGRPLGAAGQRRVAGIDPLLLLVRPPDGLERRTSL